MGKEVKGRSTLNYTGLKAVHSFPVFTTPVLIKGREVATLPEKPQQPVAVESAVRESSRSNTFFALVFLPTKETCS